MGVADMSVRERFLLPPPSGHAALGEDGGVVLGEVVVDVGHVEPEDRPDRQVRFVLASQGPAGGPDSDIRVVRVRIMPSADLRLVADLERVLVAMDRDLALDAGLDEVPLGILLDGPAPGARRGLDGYACDGVRRDPVCVEAQSVGVRRDEVAAMVGLVRRVGLMVDPPCLAPAVRVVDVPDVGMAVLDDAVVDHGRRMAAVVQHVRQVRADHVGDSEREGVDAVAGIGLEHPGLVDAVIVLVEAHAAPVIVHGFGFTVAICALHELELDVRRGDGPDVEYAAVERDVVADVDLLDPEIAGRGGLAQEPVVRGVGFFDDVLVYPEVIVIHVVDLELAPHAVARLALLPLDPEGRAGGPPVRGPLEVVEVVEAV